MSSAGPTSPERDAEVWFAHVAGALRSAMPYEAPLPAKPQESLAAFVARVLDAGQELVVLVPGDDVLPGIAGALDLAIRPLCLVLPQAEFASGIALRASLSLLASRLRRDGDDSRSAAWQAQRKRLERLSGLWGGAQDVPALAGEADPPGALSKLFPAVVMPLAGWRRQAPRPEAIFVFYGCDAPPGLDVDAGRQLHVDLGRQAQGAGKLAASDETTRLLLARARLSQDIADLELELASVQAELGEFTAEYYRRVGALMAEHDAIQATLSARRAAEAPADAALHEHAAGKARQARASADESRRCAGLPPSDAPPFHPKHETKQLFRRLAQQIHPDRAVDAEDRAWRTQLMSEANRAYRHGDLRGLQEIAALWEEQPDAGRRASPRDAVQIEQQLKRLRARLGRIEGELHRLFGSRLYQLFIAARQAGRQGRDLLEEMANRLAADIAGLRRTLESSPP